MKAFILFTIGVYVIPATVLILCLFASVAEKNTYEEPLGEDGAGAVGYTLLLLAGVALLVLVLLHSRLTLTQNTVALLLVLGGGLPMVWHFLVKGAS